MSKIIQLLAEQAKNSIPQGTLSVTEWIETYNLEFARLLINESVTILKTSVSTYDSRALFNPVEIIDRSVASMKKHFGVEE
jgi:hypothetical protein